MIEQQNSQFEIQLLPEGKFLVTLDDGQTIKGWFSMYALNRFCEKRKITYFQAIALITMGLSIADYAELVLLAFEDYYREDIEQCRFHLNGEKTRWSSMHVMDFVFEPAGGFASEKLLALFEHAVGRLTTVKEREKSQAEFNAMTDEQKKS